MTVEAVEPRGLMVATWDAIEARDGLPTMTEWELIEAHGGLPGGRNGALSVREMHQRAVVAAIFEAETLLIARGIG